MTDKAQISILRRMAKVALPIDDPAVMTPSRALRQAFSRAAETSVQLAVTVLGVTEEEGPLEQMLDQIDEAHLLVEVVGQGMLAGLAAMDVQTRSAVIELSTMGKLSAVAAVPRPVTGTDVMLCTPLVAEFLTLLPGFCADTTLDGWADGYVAGGRIASRRAAGLRLPDAVYRIARLTLDFGGAARQGEVVLMLPAHHAEAPPPPVADAPSKWAEQMVEAVGAAPANLHAVLHRLRLPIHQVEAFDVGQVIPLPGVTVSSVRLEGPDGALAARARLGQVSGMRAVRIEAMPVPELKDVVPNRPERTPALEGTN